MVFPFRYVEEVRSSETMYRDFEVCLCICAYMVTTPLIELRLWIAVMFYFNLFVFSISFASFP